MQTNILKSISYKRVPSFTDLSSIDFAVQSGVDGIILKEETTLSSHHVDIVRNLTEILLQMESYADHKTHFEELVKFYRINQEYDSNKTCIIENSFQSIFEITIKMSFDMEASFIILYTDNYRYAKYLSKFQPNCKIVCVTNDESSIDFMSLCRGVITYYSLEIDNGYKNEKLLKE